MANPYRNTGKAGSSSPAQFNPFKEMLKQGVKFLTKKSKPMAVPAKNLKLLNKNRIPFEATIKPTNVPVVGTIKEAPLPGVAAAATGGYLLGDNNNKPKNKPKRPSMYGS